MSDDVTTPLCLCGEFWESHHPECPVVRHVTALRAERDAARKGLDAVEALMAESTGVVGLHLNGDVATWESLRTGGQFEEWLLDFDAARAAEGGTTT